MARVVKLSQLVPEDVILDLGGGRTHRIPGATDAVTMIELSSVQEELVENQIALIALREEDEPDPVEAERLGRRQSELVLDLDARMLALFRVHDPDIAATGLSGEQLGQLLSAILNDFAEQVGDDPPTKRPTRTTTRKASSGQTTRSKRSGGSARS